MNSKSYLVTGGAGFIGSVVAAALVADGHHVVVIDNLSTGDLQNLPAGVEFIRAGCEDEGIPEMLGMRTFETIYHIAGQSSGEVSFENPVYDMQANVQSTLVLLKYALATGCKNFIYASSMSVYGDAQHLPVNEEAKTEPKSFYAVGKLASEHYLRIYSALGIRCVGLRLFNVYGRGQNLKNLKQGMASIYLAQAITTGRILVKGSAERFRDFVHIDDVAKAFRKAGDTGIASGVYNVCRGEKVHVSDILNLISGNLPFKTTIEFIEATPGDQFGIYGDPALFEATFGGKNNIPFNQGMIDMIHWALTILK